MYTLKLSMFPNLLILLLCLLALFIVEATLLAVGCALEATCVLGIVLALVGMIMMLGSWG